MSRTLWIAAAVDLVAVAAMLAAPSVRHLQRLDEPQLEQSAQQSVADRAGPKARRACAGPRDTL
jgi:hypothetical protein